MSIVAFRGNLVLPDKIVEGVVVCENDRIAAVRKGNRTPRGATVIDSDGFVAPGFVDIHLHGGGGADYMDGTPEAVRTVNRTHLRSGSTTVFPTTTTGSPEQIDRMLDACAEVRRNWTPADGARIAGVHLYGPYFAEDKVGCHSVEGRRDPGPDEYDRYFKRRGLVKIATCAAELPGAEAFYRAAKRSKCLITCGHSNSTWDEMDRAFKAGMRHVDHFWCAMASVPSVRQRLGYPMRGSMEQYVIAKSEMSTEVIADGEHLSPELLEFAYKMKGVEKLCLVTDSSRALGMPPGRYRFGPIEDGSWFESNGKVGFVPGNGLASTVVALDAMVRHMKSVTSAPVHEAIRMASLTPAERAGVVTDVGSLEAGKFADILLLDRRLRVKRVYLAGMESRP